MKPSHVAAFSALGMLLTGLTVYWVTPAGGAAPIAATQDGALGALQGPLSVGGPTEQAVVAGPPISEITDGTTLRVEARVGHARMPLGAPHEQAKTFVLLEVKADPSATGARQPVNLAIAIDRSGSMRGNRLKNALAGAASAVRRLKEGDVVSVVAFDAKTEIVVPPTRVDDASKTRVERDLMRIRLGGDTCISCGIEEGIAQLAGNEGHVRRMIVLSDGDATAGVRDVPGFRDLASRARERNVGITTIGVDVDYNEKIMTALAGDSNGRHYFVENETAIERVLTQEAESFVGSPASGAEASIELGPGVTLARVVDRTFRREGNRIVVPLGGFAAGESKTVLAEVNVPVDQSGKLPVANVEVLFRNHTKGSNDRVGGALATWVGQGGSALDGVVAGRVERSETAAVLNEANELFQQGRIEEARQKLSARAQAVTKAESAAVANASEEKAPDVGRDLKGQVAALDEAERVFASAPPAPKPTGGAFPSPTSTMRREDKAAQKRSAANAFDMMR